MKTTWAVSVATQDAPRSDIDTFAFFNAIESFTPSPIQVTGIEGPTDLMPPIPKAG